MAGHSASPPCVSRREGSCGDDDEDSALTSAAPVDAPCPSAPAGKPRRGGYMVG